MPEEAKGYPRFVRVHDSRIMREQKKPLKDFAIVEPNVAAQVHMTAGPLFPKFEVKKDGSVWAYVTNDKEAALAASPKDATEPAQPPEKPAPGVSNFVNVGAPAQVAHHVPVTPAPAPAPVKK